MAIYRGSRYEGAYTFAEYERPEIVFLDPLRESPFTPAVDDLLIEFQDGERLDIIAFKLYGSEKLDWVILDVNPQYGSGEDIQAGDIIRCPLPEKVGAILS